MVSRPPHSHPDIPPERRGMGLTLLTRAKNPSHLVRALYLSPNVAPHPFLSGHTAEALGGSLGETLVDPSYFFTEHRWKEHRRGLGLPEETLPGHEPDAQPGTVPPLDQLPTGTVGAVALDMYGCIACLTSTGGRTNKLVGRIGDTPHMGSGFWAEEWSEPSMFQTLMKKMFGCNAPTRGIGISGTGDGDVRLLSSYICLSQHQIPKQFFIRQATAATIAHRVRYLGESLEKASSAAVESLLKDGGIGGVIVLDTEGNCELVWPKPRITTCISQFIRPFSCDASKLPRHVSRCDQGRWEGPNSYLPR